MAREAVRAIVLCEDRDHGSFLHQLLKQRGVDPIRIFVAPHGAGSAEQWVRERLEAEVVAFRARANHQANLVLFVMSDGDNEGVQGRKATLDGRLVSAGHAARGANERIVYLVSTWSIETWLFWLCNPGLTASGITEGAAYKDDATYKARVREGSISVKEAVAHWLPARATESAAVPSLADARVEWDRVP